MQFPEANIYGPAILNFDDSSLLFGLQANIIEFTDNYKNSTKLVNMLELYDKLHSFAPMTVIRGIYPEYNNCASLIKALKLRNQKVVMLTTGGLYQEWMDLLDELILHLTPHKFDFPVIWSITKLCNVKLFAEIPIATMMDLAWTIELFRFSPMAIVNKALIIAESDETDEIVRTILKVPELRDVRIVPGVK